MKMKTKTKNYIRIALILLLIFVAAYITYIVGTVYEAAPTPLDISVRDYFVGMRTSWLSGIMISITHASDTPTIIALCIVLLLLPNRLKYGVPVSISALCGVAIYKPMKELFLRARPDEAIHLVLQGGYSYPSGHSTTSVIVFGLLAYLIFKNVRDSGTRKVLGILCVILAVTIGISRMYVGVHWATDVMCGWSVGLAVLLAGITIMESVRSRRGRL